MTNRNLPFNPEETSASISLEELSALCQEDDWMDRFILDTQEHKMLRAPFHMMQETLDQCFASPCPANHRKKPFSKQMQLFIYSLRVSAAAVGAIILLFSTPPCRPFDLPGSKNIRITEFFQFHL